MSDPGGDPGTQLNARSFDDSNQVNQWRGVQNIYLGDGGSDTTIEKSRYPVIDRSYLDEARSIPKRVYLARSPTFADVVHGADPEVKYIEREQLNDFLEDIEEKLLQPLKVKDDSGLPALFLTGPPGEGKSTLVRRAVSVLVDQGKAVAVDLGVNQAPLDVSKLGLLVKQVDRIAESDLPVLVVMDDPFYLDSGWGAFLNAMAQPGHRNVAILGASPSYLFETFSARMVGPRVHLYETLMRRSTSAERAKISEAFRGSLDSESDAESTEIPEISEQHTDSDFLIIAMEQATGKPFSSILKRLWLMLNDQRPVTGRTKVSDVEWPFLAFMICAYLHRHDITCPEPLLRAALKRVSPHYSQTDYAEEVSQLKTGEGWNIFTVTKDDFYSSARIGTLHPRVADLAWNARPTRNMNPADWLLPDSFSIEHAPRVFSQLIESSRGRSIDPFDHKVARDIVAVWSADNVPTPRLCELVAGLMSVRDVANKFRGPLRRRMRRGDTYSWIAAVRLMRLSKRGSPDYEQLANYHLPFHLRNADLSFASRDIIKLLDDSRYSDIIVERLFASIEGREKWKFGGWVMGWFLENRPGEAVERFDSLVSWMHSNPDRGQSRHAFLRWFKKYSLSFSEDQHFSVLELMEDWVSDEVEEAGISLEVIPTLPYLAARSGRLRDAVENFIFDQIQDFLERNPSQYQVRYKALGVVQKIAAMSETSFDGFLLDTIAWLDSYPDNVAVREALLGTVRDLGARSPVSLESMVLSSVEWLAEHPETSGLRGALLGAVRDLGAESSGLVAEVLESSRAWLAEHPDHANVRAALLGAVRDLGARSPVSLESVVLSSVEWLAEHPETSDLRGTVLGVIRGLGAESSGLVAEVLESSRAWLAEHPDHANVRAALLGAVRDLGARSPVSLESVTELDVHHPAEHSPNEPPSP